MWTRPIGRLQDQPAIIQILNVLTIRQKNPRESQSPCIFSYKEICQTEMGTNSQESNAIIQVLSPSAITGKDSLWARATTMQQEVLQAGWEWQKHYTDCGQGLPVMIQEQNTDHLLLSGKEDAQRLVRLSVPPWAGMWCYWECVCFGFDGNSKILGLKLGCANRRHS